MNTHENQEEQWINIQNWTGFYQYGTNGDDKDHPMEMSLNFKNGQITGTGIDVGGTSTIAGTYDLLEKTFHWIKTYEKESVHYTGVFLEKRLEGTWQPIFSPYYQVTEKIFKAVLPLHTGKFFLYPKLDT